MSDFDSQSDFAIAPETRQSFLIQSGRAIPIFLQGVFAFSGRGFAQPSCLDDSLDYIVPTSKFAEVIYFRAGNLSEDLVYLCLTADNHPIRYFPISPKGDVHIPLAILDRHPAGTKLSISIAGSRGLTGSIVVDFGILEVDANG